MNKKVSKKIIIPSLILGAIACTGFYGVGATFASEEETGRETIVQRIAERFNLNTEEVEGVFEKNRAEHQVQNQERQEERLAQAVSDGNLSEEQKVLILDKMEELEAERETNRGSSSDMTREERQSERKDHRDEMDQWLEENGIDHEYLGGPQGGMRGGHNGGGFGK
jgi:hypothetical protein